MSGEEESNDQIDAQDTNDNSVSKSEFHFAASRLQQKHFSFLNLKKISSERVSNVEFKQRDRLWNESHEKIRLFAEADWDFLAFYARLVRPQVDSGEEKETRTKEGRREIGFITWCGRVSLSLMISWMKLIIFILTATAIERQNRKKMRNCWRKRPKPRRFSASKLRRTSSPAVKWEIIRFAVSTGWFPFTKMELAEFWLVRNFEADQTLVIKNCQFSRWNGSRKNPPNNLPPRVSQELQEPPRSAHRHRPKIDASKLGERIQSLVSVIARSLPHRWPGDS